MPRNKYQIEKVVAETVREWIESKFQKVPYWPCGYGDTKNHLAARDSFDDIKKQDHNKTLNTWAETWMNRKQWNTLKTYIRANRKRKNDRKKGKRTKSLDVSLDAYFMLKNISEYEKTTLSHVIETHLKKRWNEVLDVLL